MTWVVGSVGRIIDAPTPRRWTRHPPTSSSGGSSSLSPAAPDDDAPPSPPPSSSARFRFFFFFFFLCITCAWVCGWDDGRWMGWCIAPHRTNRHIIPSSLPHPTALPYSQLHFLAPDLEPAAHGAVVGRVRHALCVCTELWLGLVGGLVGCDALGCGVVGKQTIAHARAIAKVAYV